MGIVRYLAMTAAEFQSALTLPEHIAWMACHFSPYGTGLSNLPASLPKGSVLMINDRVPVKGHDPQKILDLVNRTVSNLSCCGVLLDFQRPGCAETAAIARVLTELPCPVAVSECYAKNLPCPVFLPPPPFSMMLPEYLTPWKDREVWLDTAMEGVTITVTAEGAVYSPDKPTSLPLQYFNNDLHCHYRLDISDAAAVFTLHRTREDLDSLLTQAAELGVTKALGLYQEFYASI